MGSPFRLWPLIAQTLSTPHRSLKDSGVEVDELHTLGDGEAKYFYFRDNEGNLLEGAWSIWDPVDEIKEDFMKQ